MKAASPNAGRIYGFVTSNDRDLNPIRSWDHVAAPVPKLVVHLSLDTLDLLDTTDKDGRFVFDGLSAGEYRLQVTNGYLPDAKPIASRSVRISGDDCKEELIYLSKDSLERQ